MKPMRSLCLALVFLSVVTVAHAWLRRAYSDAEVASRADLVVVGKIKPGSIVLVPHATGVAGASWEHHVELLISEVLKGNVPSNSIVVSIHYGLEPLVGGCLSNQWRMVSVKASRTNYPSDVVEVFDAGPPGSRAGVFTGDIRTNHIWLLHHVRPPVHNDSDMMGVVDPADIQPLAKRGELLKYLR